MTHPFEGQGCSLFSVLCKALSRIAFSSAIVTISLTAATAQLSQGFDISKLIVNPAPEQLSLDVKRYSTEMVPIPNSDGPDQQVMAGTIYEDQWGSRTSIHFLRMDKLGLPLVSKQFEETQGDPYQYRAVDIAAGTDNVGNNTYFITCLGQYLWYDPSTPGGWTGGACGIVPGSPTPPCYDMTAGRMDKIRIIATDDNGQLAANAALDISDIGPNLQPPPYDLDYSHLEPTGSKYIERNGRKLLFISGYTYHFTVYNSGPNSMGPNWPGLKKAFVICVDVTNPQNMFVVKGMSYDSQRPLTFNPTAPEIDCDIALRINEIHFGPYETSGSTPGIHVTGHANANTLISSSFDRSGTMNYVLRADPVSPQFLEFIYDGIIVNPGNSGGYGEFEYGFDIIEDGVKVILFSNHMEDVTHYKTANPYEYYATGINPYPYGMIFTELDLTFAPNPIKRWEIRHLWGIQALSGVRGATATIAGLMDKPFQRYRRPPVLPTLYSFSKDNILPYLLDVIVDLGNTPPITATNNSFTVYNNNAPTGTGVVGTHMNNYYDLGLPAYGGGNIYWGPTFAARGISDDIMVYMSAPRRGTNFLRLKWIMADFTNSTPGGGPYYDNCETQDVSLSDDQIDYGYAASGTIQPHADVMTLDETWDIPINDNIIMIGTSCSATPDYKPSGIKSVHVNTDKTSLYPNPANNQISLALASTVSLQATITVELVNMQGQVVASLYEGPAAKASQSYVLPALASGLYIAHVYADGKMIHQQKLIVQQ